MLQRAVQKIRATLLASSCSTLLRRSLAGSVLLWLAYPPVGWSLLAWVAPVLWIGQIMPPKWPEQRPYLKLWSAGTLFWLLALHWIRLPHPLNYLAWLALAAYLGIYLPLFVALSRVAVHRMRIPLWLTAPVVWTGLDLLRGHLMTGFLMGSLAHTQVAYPRIIQIADLVGEYGVTFLIVLVASCIAQALLSYQTTCRETDRSRKFFCTALCLLPGVAAMLAAIAYGNWQIIDLALSRKLPQQPLRIALIQGNTLADWKSDPEKQNAIMQEYLQLSSNAVENATSRKVDLVVWPETSFRQTLLTTADGYSPPPERVHHSHLTAAQNELAVLVRQLGTAVLVGVDRTHLSLDASGQMEFAFYNSSILVDADGKQVGTYDKMHRVPFGEFIPLAEWFPFLYRLTPLTGGIQAGQSPTAMQLDGTTYAVNICYETVVPHLIRQQVMQLTDAKTPPDVLVNLTNDAWFWGSSELDMHLACGVFRAIETRTPLVIAANGGLSAHIERTGSIRAVSQRQRPEALLVDISKPPHGVPYPSLYIAWGDWFASICMLCCTVLAVHSRIAIRCTGRRAMRGDAAD